MRTVKINVTKINKARLFKGEKGTYLDLVLIDKPDDYGNDGFVCQSISKEEREMGLKAPIIGNWRRIETKAKTQPKPSQRAGQANSQADLPAAEEDDVPF